MKSFGSAVDSLVYAVIVIEERTLSREVTLFSQRRDAVAYLNYTGRGYIKEVEVRRRIE